MSPLNVMKEFLRKQIQIHTHPQPRSLVRTVQLGPARVGLLGGKIWVKGEGFYVAMVQEAQMNPFPEVD